MGRPEKEPASTQMSFNKSVWWLPACPLSQMGPGSLPTGTFWLPQWVSTHPSPNPQERGGVVTLCQLREGWGRTTPQRDLLRALQLSAPGDPVIPSLPFIPLPLQPREWQSNLVKETCNPGRPRAFLGNDRSSVSEEVTGRKYSG